MSMYRKLTTVAAVAALTLGLAACGGGGSDQISNVVDEEPTMDDSTMDDSTMDDSTMDDSTTDDDMKDDDMDTVMSDEEMTGRALGVATALTGDTSDGDAPSARITRGESGAASIAVKGWTASAAAPAGAAGWSGMMFDGAGLLNKGQSVVIYSNIEAAKRKAFDGISGTGLYTATPDGGVTFVAEAAGVAAHLTFDSTSANAVSKAQAAHLDKSRFPQPGAAKPTTYGTGPTDSHKKTFPGTFRGASGTYECTGTCSVTAPGSNAANEGYTFAGTWTFTPGAGQKGVEQDTNHINFGWWIDSPTKVDSGGDYVYDVEVFARRVGGTIVGALTALDGTATYSGPAGGVYVTKTGEGDALTATHGTFIASAELVADFDGDVGGTETAMLSGEIANFSGGAGMDDWSIKLGATAVTTGTAGTPDIPTGVSGGKTSGTGTGSWSAQFHGGTGAAGIGVDAAPAAVVGTFNAHSDTTHIVGAFGADKQ